MEVRRNYTVALPSLNHQTAQDTDKGRILHFLIKHYAEGAFTPYLQNLNKGDLFLWIFSDDFWKERHIFVG